MNAGEENDTPGIAMGVAVLVVAPPAGNPHFGQNSEVSFSFAPHWLQKRSFPGVPSMDSVPDPDSRVVIT